MEVDEGGEGKWRLVEVNEGEQRLMEVDEGTWRLMEGNKGGWRKMKAMLQDEGGFTGLKHVWELDWSAANLKTAQAKLVRLWPTITRKLKMAADSNPVTNVFQN